MNSERVAEYIAEWMTGYLNGAGAAGFVVGISGGIDSAVVSSLAALSGSRTLCVTLPIHQARCQMERAQEHIEMLERRYDNVESAQTDLTVAYDVFEASFGSATKKDAALGVIELAGANVRSRLRMTALYYYAGLNNMLVVGTGNKIEDFGVGFFTKYGDGGVDISPVADLTKTEVYNLGKWLGIPESILQASPTDGLFGDDRTDEEQIGATYPELERAMSNVENGIDPASLTEDDRRAYDIYIRRNRANRHKMEPIPVCRIPSYLK